VIPNVRDIFTVTQSQLGTEWVLLGSYPLIEDAQNEVPFLHLVEYYMLPKNEGEALCFKHTRSVNEHYADAVLIQGGRWLHIRKYEKP
jgi:hypothetical protein